ncbi:conserved hypothetical protein [Pseudomonas sp. 8Z]|uniref:DUF6776 family protein n=1 Tax=Pseudomonas sp. 8Z TaxID=2653166 RepID=UPI0012EF4579|nr:DUF6776 family protein [Pseudomonas sp. 8Z]VXC92831.1 conserved hypothetical protein [Pseudomonas sp. 8Z]
MSAGWEVRFSDPRRERLRRRLVWFLVLSIPLVFAAGWFIAYLGFAPDAEETQTLQARIVEQDKELEFLRQRLAVVGSGEKVGQQAMEQNRRTIKLLEEQVFALQQDVAFYKGVLAPGSRRDGLRIRAFELQATDDPLRFRYKLLLSRVGSAEQPLEGKLRISIEGKQDGKAAKLALAAVSEEFEGEKTPFSFKHFQSLPEAGRFGELALPKGFVPSQVKVEAEVSGQKLQSRTFKWLKKE